MLDKIMSLKCKLKIIFYRFYFSKKISLPLSTSFRRWFVINIRSSERNALAIGENCFFNNGCSLNVHSKVLIGDYCIFGENVLLYDHDHSFSGDSPFNEQPIRSSGITIGRNCWFGSNVIILRGVHIGNNCVIGANTVVTKDIPSDTVIYAKQQIIQRPRKYN